MTGHARLVWCGMAVTVGAIVAACAPPRLPAPPNLEMPTRITVRSGSGITTVPLDEYVLGSVLAEISPLDESPATVARVFEVQAVVARTYAVAHEGRHRSEGYDLCDSTHCQLYEPKRIQTSRFAAAARAAVARTSGVILMYGTRPAEALYHADCGGYTASADAVWGGVGSPYLLARPDDVRSVTHRAWQFSVPTNRAREALNADATSEVGKRLDAIRILERDRSGRAEAIELRGEHTHVLRGEQLRAILNRTLGDRALMSTRFTITHDRDAYVFDGTGFGHGVGLCQVGAMARARIGEPVDSILSHYFTGARVVQGR